MPDVGYEKGDSSNLPKISAFTAFQFLNSSPQFTGCELRGAKTVRSTRSDYGDNAIGRVQVKKNWPVCWVCCEVTPEHNIRKPGYKVQVNVNEDKEEIEEATCDGCRAGAGGCKHVVAAIFWLHRRSEDPSPTETVCYWKKPKLAQVARGALLKASDLNGPTQRCRTGVDVAAFFTKVTGQLRTNQVKCHVTMALEPRGHDCSIHSLAEEYDGDGTAEDFLLYASDRMDGACGHVEENTRNQSESKLWHEMRYGRITASRMYEASVCKTCDGSLVESIFGAAAFTDTPAMERGRRLEQEVLNIVAEHLGKTIAKAGLFLHASWPAFGASPDGLTEQHIFEVKCPTSVKTMEAYVKNNEIQKKVLAQMQAQMYLSGRESGYLCVAHPDFEVTKKVDLYNVEFNKVECDVLFQNCLNFWRNNIFDKLL